MSSVDARPFVYLDNNATTPCAPEVLAEMLPYLTKEYGNPASPHRAGRAAAAAVLRAREELAKAVGVESNSVVFTSGATEANNLAILGAAKTHERRPKILVSAIEHKSVSLPAATLAEQGYTVMPLPVCGGSRRSTIPLTNCLGFCR